MYNIHGNNVPDVPYLINHLKKLPKKVRKWILVMDNLDLAKQIKTELPDSNVVFRAWPDDKAPQEHGYLKWLKDRISRIGDADLWLYLNNESGASDETLNWLSNCIVANKNLGLNRKLLIGGFSTGTLGPEDFKRPAFKRLLQLCSENRENVVLHLHEYAGGIITSGQIGGNPTLIQPETWLKDIINLIFWHVGRVKFLIQACQEMQIPIPRIIITEFGFDSLGDIKNWLESLIHTPGYSTIRGWKTLYEQWKAWFRGWSAEQALFEQVLYALRYIYWVLGIEGVMFYCWGHSSNEWEPYDVSEAFEFHRHLESIDMEEDQWLAGIIQLRNTNALRIRQEPTTNSIHLGWLYTGDMVSSTYVLNNNFIRIRKGNIVGWASFDYIADITPQPIDPPVPPEEEQPKDHTFTLEVTVHGLEDEASTYMSHLQGLIGECAHLVNISTSVGVLK